MDILASLEEYISAKKNMSLLLILIGLSAFGLAAYFHFTFSPKELTKGGIIGMTVSGSILLVVGSLYYIISRNTQQKLIDLNQQGQSQFIPLEVERISEERDSFLFVKIVVWILTIAPLLLLFLGNSSFVQGIGLGGLFLTSPLLRIMYYILDSIKEYSEVLEEAA